jgi:hypothetical protein
MRNIRERQELAIVDMQTGHSSSGIDRSWARSQVPRPPHVISWVLPPRRPIAVQGRAGFGRSEKFLLLCSVRKWHVRRDLREDGDAGRRAGGAESGFLGRECGFLTMAGNVFPAGYSLPGGIADG